MSKSEWHYPRAEFAKEVFGVLTRSPSSAVSLFGPRRTGKTEFLREDLAPLAEKRGHRVVYANLWQTLEAPLAGLLYAFDSALRGGRLTDRFMTAASALAPKFKLKPPGGGAEIEIDTAALRGKPHDNHLILLDQYCGRLANAKKPTLLLFDEFQELARSRTTAPIIAALRTSLDTRKRALVSVFTGSSQEGLRKMFSAREAPFYHFASPMDLPALGPEFVSHQLGVFADRARRQISKAEALRVFQKVGGSPLFFQRWLIAMMIHSRMTSDEAIERVLMELGERLGFAGAWTKLKPVQRAVLSLLARGINQVHSGAAGERLAAMTGADAPDTTTIQSTTRRLARLGLADEPERKGDQWRLNDPLLALWVQAQPDHDLIIPLTRTSHH